MAKESKFKIGQKVESVLNEHEIYEVVEVLRNELKVKVVSNGLEFSCKKSLFEISVDGLSDLFDWEHLLLLDSEKKYAEIRNYFTNKGFENVDDNEYYYEIKNDTYHVDIGLSSGRRKRIEIDNLLTDKSITLRF